MWRHLVKELLDRPGGRAALSMLARAQTRRKFGVWAKEDELGQLRMERRLDDLPPLRVPEGYELRQFRPGDEPGWTALVHGQIGEYDEAKARAEFFDDPTVVPEGIFFAAKGSQCAATATARRSPDGSDAGSVHMVVTAPQHRGRGLGTAISLAALHRLREWGFSRGYLITDDSRTDAVRMYLALGFKPVYSTRSDRRRWRLVLLRAGAPSSLPGPGARS